MAASVLELANVHLHYGPVHALKGVSMTIGHGQIVALLGANGAGKSSTLRTIAGLQKLSDGEIFVDGMAIKDRRAHMSVRRGVVLVPEGRGIFPNLTVQENLMMGAYARRDADEIRRTSEWVFDLFPILAERRTQMGTNLSGGEQQMLAIGRGLMAMPRVLLLDEPSLGLAPLITQKIFSVIKRLAGGDVSILLVEQNARQAMRISDKVYVMQLGRISEVGDGQDADREAIIRQAYLGHRN